MENGNTQRLAEKIALILQESGQQNNDDFLRSSLEKINQRLDKIESQISAQSQSFKVQTPKTFHPSQEKFTSLAELADEIINSIQNEKTCSYEPTAKPCDNCSMCNSRGF